MVEYPPRTKLLARNKDKRRGRKLEREREREVEKVMRGMWVTLGREGGGGGKEECLREKRFFFFFTRNVEKMMA